jgi:hypothetical protein
VSDHQFFKDAIRIDAADIDDAAVAKRCVPARIGASQCGAFAVAAVDSHRVEICWPHHAGSSGSRQILELYRVTTPTGYKRSFLLRCPACNRRRVRLFFVTRRGRETADFSFACLKCAESSLDNASSGPAPRKTSRRSARPRVRYGGKWR